MTPAWILDRLAVLMLAVAAVSAARLAAARPWRPGSVIVDTDIAHLLMAIAMAGVLTPVLSTLPDGAWEFIFGALIAWYGFRVALDARANGVRALAGGHCAPHLVHSAAMLYMFLAATPAAGPIAGTPGMTAGSSPMLMLMLSDPTLAFAFALVLIGYVVWDLDQLSGRRYSLAAAHAALAGVTAGAGPMAAAEPATSPAFAAASPAAGGGDHLADAPAEAAGAATAVAGGHAVDCNPDALGDGAVAGGALGRFLLSPAVTVGGRVTMGVVMTFMLLIAI